MDNKPSHKKSSESILNPENYVKKLSTKKQARVKKKYFREHHSDNDIQKNDDESYIQNFNKINSKKSFTNNNYKKRDSINSKDINNKNSINSKDINNNKLDFTDDDEKGKATSFTNLNKNICLTKSQRRRPLGSSLKNIKNKKNDQDNTDILKKRTDFKTIHDTEFSFFEQPEFFDGKTNEILSTFVSKKRQNKTQIIKFDNYDDNDNNDFIISLTGLSNQNIIQLNELQKDFKKSVIGYTKIKQINSKGKTFLMEDNEENESSDSFFNRNESEKEGEEIIDKERYRMLQRVIKVYDSLDEEDLSYNNYYIDPDNKFIILLDVLLVIFTVYDLIYIPLFLGKNDIYCRLGKFFHFTTFIDIITDILYIIDNIIPFFLAYYNHDDILQTELYDIRKHYLRTYFLIDFLAAIPFNTFLSIFDKKCNDEHYLIAPLYQNNIYYLLIIIQLPKAIKVFNKNWLTKYIKNYLNQYEHFNIYLGLYESISVFFIGIHIVSCIFIFIGKNQYPGWIIHFGYENKDFKGLYLIAIYYIITTVTTVGYGDLSCITPIEKVFGLFMEIVGIFAYSFALTEISNYVKVISDKNEEYHQKCEILNDIRVSFPELSDDLYNRINSYLKRNLFSEKKDKKLIINSLPVGLKNELVYHMYESIINNFVFFKNFNNIDFIVKVILSFKPILALNNDILVKDGDFVDDIIFIKSGRLSLDLPIVFENVKKSNSTKDEQKDIFLENLMAGEDEEEEEDEENEIIKNTRYYKVLELQKNEHFGDILMFLNKRSNLRVKVKSMKAELFYLNKKDAIEISISYPYIWKKINKKSLFNWEQIKRLINKIYKIFNKNKYSDNDNEQTIYLSTSIIENTDLQSIPSLTELTLDEDERTQLKIDKKILEENTKKNKEFKSLKTIKESKTFEDKSEHSLNKNNFEKSDISETNNFNYTKSNLSEKSVITKIVSFRSIDDDNVKLNEQNLCKNNNKLNLKIDENENRKKLENSNDNIKNLSSKSNLINITPYKPNEINNEIYPFETTIATSENQNKHLNPNIILSNIQSLLKSRVHSENNNISICSTEISFSIDSKYDNIDKISNYKYSKSLKIQRKIRNTLIRFNEFESSIKSNLKKRSKKSKGVNIRKTNSNTVKFNDIKNKNNLTVNSNANNLENSSISKKNNMSSLISKKSKSNISTHSFKLGNEKNKNFKRKKTKKNLLNVIHQNMERNYLNLNDPNLFYLEFFQHYFEKTKSKVIENPFADLDEELIKKFILPNDEYKKKSPLSKFNEMLKKI